MAHVSSGFSIASGENSVATLFARGWRKREAAGCVDSFVLLEAPRRAVGDHQIVPRRARDGAIEQLERLLVALVDVLDGVAARDLQADMPLLAVGGLEVGADARIPARRSVHPAVGIAYQLGQRRAAGQHEADRAHQRALADAVVAEQQRPFPRDARHVSSGSVSERMQRTLVSSTRVRNIGANYARAARRVMNRIAGSRYIL